MYRLESFGGCRSEVRVWNRLHTQCGSLFAAALVFLASLCAAPAQPNAPRIGFVYPAGGKSGSEVQVSVGGQFLDGVTNVYFSGAGVHASVLEHIKPLTKQQLDALKEKLQELQERRSAARSQSRRHSNATGTDTANVVWTAADEASVEQIRKKIATFQRRPSNPAIAETAVLRVTIDPGVDPELREFRLGTPAGISNPILFGVGDLPEVIKPDVRKAAAELPRNQRAGGAQNAVPAYEERVTLPAMLNGQVMQGGVDRYRFRAIKGQQLVAVASARELLPYLPDAVPGWFQATLALYDAKGKELSYQDDFKFNPDPVIHCEIPADGDYVLEMRDAIYRGREDFVYRICIGEIPFISSIFPLGAGQDTRTTVQLRGWNIPAAPVEPTKAENERYAAFISVTRADLRSNRLPFALDTLPEQNEKEPNNNTTTAQQLSLPTIINGTIAKPGDTDVFRFAGRAGQKIVAEITARRLGSPLDSSLRLEAPAGELLASNDDFQDKGSGLLTHHADSLIHFTLPADGAYTVVLSDSQRHGGEDYGYRLRLSSPRPDFAVRVVPSSVTVRPGMCVPVTAFVLRKDGFTNEVRLAIKDGPSGVRLSGARIPPNQESIRLSLGVPPGLAGETFRLEMEAKAVSEQGEVSRPVVPAEDMTQAFAYHHLVPAREMRVVVAGRGTLRGELKLANSETVEIPAGGTATVRITGPPGFLSERVQLAMSEGPEGIAIKETVPGKGWFDIVLESQPGKMKPGLAGNLIVSITRTAEGAVQKKKQAARPAVIGILPAIPFEVIPK